MTLDEFRSNREFCDDLGARLRDSRWDGAPPAQGWLYLDCLYIEQVQDHWPEEAKKEGKWSLTLERDEYISDDLPMLEQKLYDWAEWAGFLELA